MLGDCVLGLGTSGNGRGGICLGDVTTELLQSKDDAGLHDLLGVIGVMTWKAMTCCAK